MDYLLPTFKAVSIIFAVSAVYTGAQAIIDPIGFSKFFGIVVSKEAVEASLDKDSKASASTTTATRQHERSLTLSYISLMGVRQGATGIILLIFAYQNKWTEAATILATIGIVVAGTDGIYLARSGATSQGIWHAIPGAIIAALAGGVVYLSS